MTHFRKRDGLGVMSRGPSEALGSHRFPHIARFLRKFDGGIDCLVLEAMPEMLGLSLDLNVFDAVRTTLGDVRVGRLEIFNENLDDEKQYVPFLAP